MFQSLRKGFGLGLVIATLIVPARNTVNGQSISKSIIVALQGEASFDPSTQSLTINQKLVSVDENGKNLAVIYDTSYKGKLDTNGHLPVGDKFENLHYTRLSPDGAKIVVLDTILTVKDGDHRIGSDTLLIVDADGKHTVKIAPEADKAIGKAIWSSDSKQIAYTVRTMDAKQVEFRAYDLETKAETVMFETSGEYSLLDWSADRKNIVVAAKPDLQSKDTTDLFNFNVESKNLTRMYSILDDGNLQSFKWSPDGKFGAICISLISLQGANSKNGVYIVDVDGKTLVQLVDLSPKHCSAVSWSADGLSIMYDSDESFDFNTASSEIDQVDVNTKNVTFFLKGARSPSWSTLNN
jgi:hypothetical protein